MKYVVYLIQAGISAQTHPVSGKSGKQYGTAVQSPKDKGVTFKMSLQAYTKDQFDLIGNTAPNQQWVPDFVPEVEESNDVKPKCGIPAGCHLGPGGSAADATHIWDRDLYCHGHAPNNAKALYADSPPLAVVQAPAPVVLPEVPPTVVEKGASANEPRVDLPPPQVGEPARIEPPISQRPVPPARQTEQPPPAAGAPQPPQPPQPQPTLPPAPQPSAVEVITAAVTAAIGPLEKRLMTHIDEKMSGKPQKKPAKRQALGGPNLAPTAFQMLQQKAKGLGINVYGMGKAKLEAAIAAKESGQA